MRLNLGFGRPCSPISFASSLPTRLPLSVNLTGGKHSTSGHPLLYPMHAHVGSRYRLITPFGKDTIRRFANNASQMKKLAGYHFEDLLQVWKTTYPLHLHAAEGISTVRSAGAGRPPPCSIQRYNHGSCICDGLLACLCEALATYQMDSCII